jgi:molybdate/tungstate transport system permease protein
MVLAGIHFFLPIEPGLNILLFIDNCLFLVFFRIYDTFRGRKAALLYSSGYLALFSMVYLLAGQKLIFSLAALLYPPLFRLPRALGHFLILMLSLTLITPYWIQSAVIGSIVLEILYQTIFARPSLFISGSFAMGMGMIVFLLMPILYLITMSSPQTLLITAGDSEVRMAVWTTLWTSTLSCLIATLFGVPLAYALTRTEFRGKAMILALIDMPILIPQTVVGLSILVLAGPKAPLGIFMSSHFGIRISGTALGIILAQLFVSSPFVIRAAMASFMGVDTRLESISRTLGASQASTFFRISLPLASRGVTVGAILTWCRAVSEAGSLMVLAYHPFTVSILVADRFTRFGLEEARPIAVIFVLLCLGIFVSAYFLARFPAGFLAEARRRDSERGFA